MKIGLIAIFVCLARMIDVSLGTVKLKAVMRGNKGLAFVVAFIEVIIYTLAASYAFDYIDEPIVLIMFAFGYASGNALGIMLDEKLNKGNVLTFIILNHDGWKLADDLREKGYGVTTNKGYGINGNQKVELKVIVPKERLKDLKTLVYEYDKDAYVVALDVKDVNRMDVRK